MVPDQVVPTKDRSLVSGGEPAQTVGYRSQVRALLGMPAAEDHQLVPLPPLPPASFKYPDRGYPDPALGPAAYPTTVEAGPDRRGEPLQARAETLPVVQETPRPEPLQARAETLPVVQETPGPEPGSPWQRGSGTEAQDVRQAKVSADRAPGRQPEGLGEGDVAPPAMEVRIPGISGARPPSVRQVGGTRAEPSAEARRDPSWAERVAEELSGIPPLVVRREPPTPPIPLAGPSSGSDETQPPEVGDLGQAGQERGGARRGAGPAGPASLAPQPEVAGADARQPPRPLPDPALPRPVGPYRRPSSERQTAQEIEKLREDVQELATKMARGPAGSGRPEDPAPPAAPSPPPPQPVVILHRAAAPERTPRAFWERRYLGRTGLRTLR
jgi:hypothetical protein